MLRRSQLPKDDQEYELILKLVEDPKPFLEAAHTKAELRTARQRAVMAAAAKIPSLVREFLKETA
jgi:hypothetical protein